MMEYAVTDFPEPDSPTMPSTFRRSRLKDTPLTAFTSPAGVKKEVCKSRTCNNSAIFSASCQFRSFGSNASRSPSPKRFRDSTIREITTAGITSR